MVEWLKMKALNSRPSTAKKRKKPSRITFASIIFERKDLLSG
jgi:hypothetical protein